MTAEVVFFVCLALWLHTYLLFPLTLPLFSGWLGRRIWKGDEEDSQWAPKVSILVSAFNEETVIEAKIRNCLELDYPPERLQILIGDDGSKDHTAEIIRRYMPKVTLIQAERNQGKAAMLNRLAQQADGDILLFCDANTLFFPNVVRKLTQPFTKGRIGCVCGHLILSDESGSALGEGEAAYWDFESEIKKFEGLLGVVIGGNGAIYAIRRNLFTPLPVQRSVMDDFYVTVKILQQGYQSIFISSAIGTEQTSKAGVGEFYRKVRIGRANFNYLFSYLPLLNPFRPLVAYFFFSHKLLRWFSPHLILGIVLTNIALWNHGIGFQITLMLELLVFLLGLAGLAMGNGRRKLFFINYPFYFLTMNFALFRGFLQSFRSGSGGGWSRVERSAGGVPI
ncbi:MAG TPA: glycosyltransferase family 2 protein [Fibrobacteraceae bacterium]|nr:glycosyltransferase family 2 protein [Fibrobacteraceae bacterium]